MSSGFLGGPVMFLRRALRYRYAQALVLTGVSLLIGTCAAFAPWFARAVEQTVTTETLHSQRQSAAWQLEATPPAASGVATAKKPEDLAQLVPADLKPLFSPPLYGQTVDAQWRLSTDPKDVKVVGRLVWRDAYCGQLVLIEGRCPKGPGEVAVSTADKANFNAKTGSVLIAKPTDYAGGANLTVVGVYKPVDPLADYWFGRAPVGRSHLPEFPDPGSGDFLLTDRATFVKSIWGHRSTLDTRPLAGVVRADDLQRIKDATEQVDANASQLGLETRNASGLVGVIDQIQAERKQATTIIPLVMVQVALFGVVVLALALSAVVDQRRPEIAVARLRGASARRTGRSLAVELGVAVLTGLLAGIGTGFLLLLVVRATWLNGGAPIEVPWTVPAAVALAVVVGIAVVVWSVRSVVQQPISTLLRRVVPRRRSRALGMIDLSIIMLASAGLVAALTGGGRGPLPVLTPTLLALAVGLTFAHLLLPAAGFVSRRALRRGRLGLALGALQVSRRPAVTRIVAVVAVATALASFAGQAASVAGDNRDLRAGYETGAEGVLSMSVTDLSSFSQAIDKIDPDRHWLTPVVLSRPPSPDGLTGMMIEPDSFRRIAFRGDQLTDAAGYDALKAPAKPDRIDIHGHELTITATPGKLTPVAVTSFNGQQPAQNPAAKSVILEANVVSRAGGARFLVRFPPMPLVAGRTFVLKTQIGCLQGCQLVRLGLARGLNDPGGFKGRIEIGKLTMEGGKAVPLGAAADWRPVKAIDGTPGSIAVDDRSGGGLAFDLTNTGNEQFIQHGSVPAVVPALISPGFVFSDATTVPGTDGLAVPVQKIDRPQGTINRYPLNAAVVDLENIRRLGGSVDQLSTEFQVWLNADGLANSQRVIDGLGQAGMVATLIDRHSDRIATYGRSASALALQLTPVVGIAGWSLAIIVLLLMVVTSWRSRAQDYASLRITGVPAGTTGRAARWEQTGPVALAALLGSACGVFGAQIALPMIPLFAETLLKSPIPLDLHTNWTVALLLWLIGTAVLTTTTLLLGTGVNRRAGYHRIREELS
ncbi:FtsX-like permease family protein [Kribbella voronezhensis]|uniref:FtsX-like permease family protein n=2 Tax=Kribbella voronezhensis TaxID=2512212 RepID=A0A4R7T6V5_9ACTN|nr:FtsX-like permease family protein [Kribbella voronezhensis]